MKVFGGSRSTCRPERALVVEGVLMAVVLILRPSGLTGGREFSLPRFAARRQQPAPARRRRPRDRSVCVAGAGVIGSLLAGHLARVADVSVLARREEHARALNEHGLRVSGRSDFTATVTAATDPAELPEPDLVIVACKGTDLESIARQLEGAFAGATVMTVQNGLGAEEIVGAHGDWPLLSSVTFMSGTRHEDTHVEYVLDTATWIGPYRDTTPDEAREVAELIVVVRPEGGGVRRPAAGAVVEADLQRDRERRRRADGASARLPLRRDGAPRRPRPSRPRPRRRGQGRRRRCRDRAVGGPVGDERPRDAARPPALSVDARGRRGAPADGDRADHRIARARGGSAPACRCRCTPRSTGSSRRRRPATREDLCRRLRRRRLAVRGESRAARRRRGVGVRRVAGARRRDQRERAAALAAPATCSRTCGRRPIRRSCRRATSASSRRRRCTRSRRSRATAHAFAGGSVATVQNGIGNEEMLAAHVERVIRGTTFPAGKILEPGHVQWDVKGDTTLGPFEPQPAPFADVRAARRRVHARRHADDGGRGRARPAVAQGDLQRGDESGRRAHRPDARPRLRAARPARARHRARRRGEGGRGGAGDRARLRSGGADRPRREAGGRRTTTRRRCCRTSRRGGRRRSTI